nr:PREDICTED: GPI ethanolamine phosphate transferase 2 isoform X3 [Tribolium castaneum]|eukprot:XP_015837705.1 PREDICTED: GPI ethanolamine phosphate transferase 2 isoform X3 [Tribolium castaneum]
MFLNYVIAAVSVLLYLHGFFPIPTRPIEKAPPSNRTHTPNAKKLVLVVIDALRLDFISATKTPFLSKSLRNNGCFIHLKVETPTVTLPRIKALTTGNVPQFVDIILNLANPTKVEDSFIHRAHAAGKKIVFYGDDIWVKLFSDEFVRSEGTSSFFVNDFTEVDDNVTRNVKLEVKRSDWDIMILHYLETVFFVK